MRSISDAQAELQTLAQWVCWYVKREGERSTKPPINPRISPARSLDERLASPTNPQTWGTYEQALRMSRYYAGIGFMFTESDPYCGVDLDKCRNAETGDIAKWAMNVVSLFGSYTEISPSGTGLHILIKANLLTTLEHLGRTDIHHKQGHLEVYDARRYFTWSGTPLSGTPQSIEARQDELTYFYRVIFPTATPEIAHPQPTPASLTDLPDEWIIERASMMRGNGPKFARLWGGDASDYTHPDGSIDHSRADAALLGMLAYWTGRDAARMEALFTSSGLYRPDRWRERSRGGETYGQTSIRQAIANCYRVYDPTWAEAHRYQPSTKKRHLPETGVSANEQKGGN